MKNIVGSPGTASGMSLRMGQCGFAAASIVVMVFSRGFTGCTAFCYLIALMGLQLLWSFGLACLDMYALRRKRDIQNPVLLSLFCFRRLGNQSCPFGCMGLGYIGLVTTALSLAAACSSAGVMILYARDLDVCAAQLRLPCAKFQIAVALSFLTCGLIAISSHVMFWILASMQFEFLPTLPKIARSLYTVAPFFLVHVLFHF